MELPTLEFPWLKEPWLLLPLLRSGSGPFTVDHWLVAALSSPAALQPTVWAHRDANRPDRERAVRGIDVPFPRIQLRLRNCLLGWAARAGFAAALVLRFFDFLQTFSCAADTQPTKASSSMSSWPPMIR